MPEHQNPPVRVIEEITTVRIVMRPVTYVALHDISRVYESRWIDRIMSLLGPSLTIYAITGLSVPAPGIEAKIILVVGVLLTGIYLFREYRREIMLRDFVRATTCVPHLSTPAGEADENGPKR